MQKKKNKEPLLEGSCKNDREVRNKKLKLEGKEESSLPVSAPAVIASIIPTRWAAWPTSKWSPTSHVRVVIVTGRTTTAHVIRVIVWAAWWWVVIYTRARRRAAPVSVTVIVVTASVRRALTVMATRAITPGWASSVIVINWRIWGATARRAGTVWIPGHTVLHGGLNLYKREKM